MWVGNPCRESAEQPSQGRGRGSSFDECFTLGLEDLGIKVFTIALEALLLLNTVCTDLEEIFLLLSHIWAEPAYAQHSVRPCRFQSRKPPSCSSAFSDFLSNYKNILSSLLPQGLFTCFLWFGSFPFSPARLSPTYHLDFSSVTLAMDCPWSPRL